MGRESSVARNFEPQQPTPEQSFDSKAKVAGVKEERDPMLQEVFDETKTYSINDPIERDPELQEVLDMAKEDGSYTGARKQSAAERKVYLAENRDILDLDTMQEKPEQKKPQGENKRLLSETSRKNYLQESKDILDLDALNKQIKNIPASTDNLEAINEMVLSNERAKQAELYQALDAHKIKVDVHGNILPGLWNGRKVKKAEKNGFDVQGTLSQIKESNAYLQKQNLLSFSAEEEDMFSEQLVRHEVEVTEAKYDEATLPAAQAEIRVNEVVIDAEKNAEAKQVAHDKAFMNEERKGERRQLKADKQGEQMMARADRKEMKKLKKQAGAGFFGRSFRKFGLALGLLGAGTGAAQNYENVGESNIAAANAESMRSEMNPKIDMPGASSREEITNIPTFEQDITEHTFTKAEIVEGTRPVSLEDFKPGMNAENLMKGLKETAAEVILDPATRMPIGDRHSLVNNLGETFHYNTYSPDGKLVGGVLTRDTNPLNGVYVGETGTITSQPSKELSGFLGSQREEHIERNKYGNSIEESLADNE